MYINFTPSCPASLAEPNEPSHGNLLLVPRSFVLLTDSFKTLNRIGGAWFVRVQNTKLKAKGEQQMQSMAMQYLSILLKLYSQHWLKLTPAPGLYRQAGTNGHISHHVDAVRHGTVPRQVCAGRPTELKTSVIVTRPASGIPAAPTKQTQK